MDCYSRQNVSDAIVDASIPGVDSSDAHRWFQTVLSPTINEQGEKGWNLAASLDAICHSASDVTSLCAQMATAVQKRLKWVGDDYFRIHPKGTGVVCQRTDGIPPFTLVEEYLGVLHAPWRWFEIQDILKRQSPNDVPDFYNIVLERPRTDPDGFEVLYVDAAAKGTFASRMSHSCDPNCQVTVLSVDGRLTIAMYTTRAVLKGQELTFDYASVTESEKEFRSAICLCGSPLCRGSFLHYAGSSAYMQIMSCRHNFLHRNAILLRTATEPLTEEDRERLDVSTDPLLSSVPRRLPFVKCHGLRAACLGRGNDRVPPWLEKWAALILEFIEEEYCLLPDALQSNTQDSQPSATTVHVKEQAKGSAIAF